MHTIIVSEMKKQALLFIVTALIQVGCGKDESLPASTQSALTATGLVGSWQSTVIAGEVLTINPDGSFTDTACAPGGQILSFNTDPNCLPGAGSCGSGQFRTDYTGSSPSCVKAGTYSYTFSISGSQMTYNIQGIGSNLFTRM
ncbi:MAG: hypothetical protein E6R03_11210 [Hyphomicrobiaceae bacterium]|nr:MAG: hypothetical protein E6R03_11210 [Hyphomicrobiaceae bacterium]